MSENKTEVHETIEEYCCACNYDQAVFERRVKLAIESKMSDLMGKVEKKRLLEELPPEYEVQGFLGAHQKTAVIAFNKALDEVLLLMKK